MAAFACATADLSAQDAMREVYNLVERGRNDEALAKLSEALAKEMPSNEALSLRDKLSSYEWIKVMIQNDRLGEAVMTLMNRSRPAEAAKSDPKIIESKTGADTAPVSPDKSKV